MMIIKRNETLIRTMILSCAACVFCVTSGFTRIDVNADTGVNSFQIGEEPVSNEDLPSEETSEDEEKKEETNTSGTTGIVFLNHEKKTTLAKTHVENYYGVKEDTAYTVSLSLRDMSKKFGVYAETNYVHAVLDQTDELLPRIWYVDKLGTRTLLMLSDIEWETSDEAVITIDNGEPVISGAGSAVLTGTTENGTVNLTVDISEPLEVHGLNKKSDKLYELVFDEEGLNFTAKRTYLWPTVFSNPDDEVTVKGGRVYKSGSQYYFVKHDFEADPFELTYNAGGYPNYMINLSQGFVLMEGDSTDGIVPGVIYRDNDRFWVYDSAETESISVPTEDETGWVEITELFNPDNVEYDPGADTGPLSDSLYYPDSEFNPYPGGLNNCTWTVWFVANQELGARLPNWGDAGNWYRRAGISGYPTGDTPAANSIIVWDHHVGYITELSADGTMMYVREGNYGGSYHEGWWPIATSRHGQEVYGYIYLTDDTGMLMNVEPEIAFLSEGFTGTEEEFLATLAEIGLEPGMRTEVYDDFIEAGSIVAYTSGDLPVGSVVDYAVSLGPVSANEIIFDETLIGASEDSFLEWLAANGLNAGNREEIETDEYAEGSLIWVNGSVFSEGDVVDYQVAKAPVSVIEPEQKIEPEIVEEQPAIGEETIG